MLKRFFENFLAVLAGLWVTIFLCFPLLMVFVGAIVSLTSTDAKPDMASLKDHNVLRISLDGTVTDRATPINLMDQLYGDNETSLPLNDIVRALKLASEDKAIDGIMLDCKGASMGMAQMQAIITAINQFKESGKWVFAYSDNYTQGNYALACAADSIFINPIGMVDVHGLSTTVVYFKDMLDKLGVDVQVVKVGTYKSAVEPYILNDMSDANREQTSQFLSNIWGNISEHIAKNRKVSTDTVNQWANGFLFAKATEDYVKLKVVDGMKYRHEFDDMIAAKINEDEPNYVDFTSYVSLQKNINSSKSGKQIAVLYAVGTITESAKDGIASETIVPQILDLAEDDDVDGLILRVNSGGGSAFASEQIWEALQQWKSITGKPFYVSMGDYAASGGYYISCGADRIYAEPLTLTGSIGIFGLIPNVQKLLNDKIGIHTSTVSTNTSNFPDFFRTMNPEQRAAMQGYVERGYELFVSRCANGRHMPVDSIKAIAEGRVWDGSAALRIGLVDKLGGLQQAIADMASELESAEDYYVVEYPAVKFKWWEELLDMSNQMQSKAMENQLKEWVPYYTTIKNIKQLAPLQARMDYIELR
ncbi:signal peptide peptidase SppA 67K type [Bacteroides sp. CAG:927]|nr:signal peptide peptidase SppA 67K type [Bacteroides sp. CAG:927]